MNSWNYDTFAFRMVPQNKLRLRRNFGTKNKEKKNNNGEYNTRLYFHAISVVNLLCFTYLLYVPYHSALFLFCITFYRDNQQFSTW